MRFSLQQLVDAAGLVHRHMPPTPQYVWPLLCQRTGATVWVKHENHTPTGAFKVRGGIVYVDWLRRERPEARGLASATRGNHGQSLARAASAVGLPVTIVVPQGNSAEKNAAMRALGARLVEHGADFNDALEHARQLAEAESLLLAPAFHRELVRGVASYALELFRAAPDLDSVYVPVGCGSGLCAVIAVRDALGLNTEVVGVVSREAAGAKLSFEQGRLVATPSADTFADGLAVRVPNAEAFEVYRHGAQRMLAVDDGEIRQAMRILHHDTHNLAEGAGAAALAGLLQDAGHMRGKRVAVVLSGGNIDLRHYAALAGDGSLQ